MRDKISLQLTLFNQSYKELDDVYHNYSKHFGLSDTVLWIVYSVLSNDEPYTQKELCDEWSYSRQTVNSALKRLEEQNMIELVSMQANRKTKQIFLTEKGKDFANKIVVPLLDAEKSAFSELDDAERDEYLRLINKHVELFKNKTAELLKSSVGMLECDFEK